MDGRGAQAAHHLASRADSDGRPKAAAARRAQRSLCTDRRTCSACRQHICACSVAQRTGGLVVVKGHVSLVGAGPGDPGLLTRKAIARLRSADLVLYDALIDDRVLKYARRAQKFFVGKRAGRHAMSQEAIHGLIIRA
ncbi:MAG: siroheme synthase, partial [Acidobacteria bacterium]